MTGINLNTKNVLKLAKVIRKSRTFSQTEVANCIKGHAARIELNTDSVASLGDETVHQVAVYHLNITQKQAIDLFAPFKISNKEAALLLEKLAETNQEDWSLVRKW